MIVDVWVRVCCATGVTTEEEEGNAEVELEVDEVGDAIADEAVEEVEEVGVILVDDEIVLEVEDVGKLPAEDVDNALDVLLIGVGVELGRGRGKRMDMMPNCLSWNS
jgi:hypothetical protein